MQYVWLVIGFECVLSVGLPGKSGSKTFNGHPASRAQSQGFASGNHTKRVSEKSF